MKLVLKRWKNSLGLRIPIQLVKKYNLHASSELELSESNGGICVIKKSKLPTIEEIANSYPKHYIYEEILPGELTSEQW